MLATRAVLQPSNSSVQQHFPLSRIQPTPTVAREGGDAGPSVPAAPADLDEGSGLGHEHSVGATLVPGQADALKRPQRSELIGEDGVGNVVEDVAEERLHAPAAQPRELVAPFSHASLPGWSVQGCVMGRAERERESCIRGQCP